MTHEVLCDGGRPDSLEITNPRKYSSLIDGRIPGINHTGSPRRPIRNVLFLENEARGKTQPKAWCGWEEGCFDYDDSADNPSPHRSMDGWIIPEIRRFVDMATFFPT